MKAALLLSLALLASACGPLRIGDPFTTPPVIREYSTEGVKLISAGIADGMDPSTFGQNTYALGPSQRLLVRLQELGSHLSAIRVGEESRVQLKIRLLDEHDPTLARQALQACPILRPWMMLATWDQAHPFDGTGRWSRPGGEFDPAECVRAPAPGIAAEGQPSPDPKELVFDVTDWFVNHARGRGTNYGLILISDQSVKIHGDRSGPHSPRLLWTE